MSMRRQLRGVLEVVTPSGTHYLMPSFTERLYLIWIFRNFRTLPLNVLSDSQRRKIESIASRYRRAELARCDEILGTIECVPAVDAMKKPVQSATGESELTLARGLARMRSRTAHGD